MKPYEPWEFCKAIDCDALGVIFKDEKMKQRYCHKCKAYQMHGYIRDHGQILEEGSGLIARVREAEADCAAMREALEWIKANSDTGFLYMGEMRYQGIGKNIQNKCEKALDPNPGSALLAELEQLRFLRPEVQWFARQMEIVLRTHDKKKGKQGWKKLSYGYLKNLLKTETEELLNVLNDQAYHVGCSRRVIHDAADIANVAMMLADNANAELQAYFLAQAERVKNNYKEDK